MVKQRPKAINLNEAAECGDLQLVQVVDKPGTEDDQAVFRVVTDHGSEHLHLDRHGDTWVPR